MISNKYLKDWIFENYPMMDLKEDIELCDLDYLDMDGFANWIVKKLTIPCVINCATCEHNHFKITQSPCIGCTDYKYYKPKRK